MSTITTDKRVAKFRTLADGLQNAIDNGRREMTQNPTPKRVKEYNSRRHDADNLERTQLALRAIAAALEAGTLPPVLDGLTSKTDVAPLVYKGLQPSGYYDVIPDREYRNKSDAGVALQILMESYRSEADVQADAERQKRDHIQALEDRLRFLKIEGFFPTPAAVIAQMVDAADIRAGMSVLEPSAGNGAIADFLRHLSIRADCIEVRPALQDILKAKGHELVGTDFLEFTGQYDRIAMNPPFERGADIDHVWKAYDCLKPAGRLVSLMSSGPFYRSDKKSESFREWLDAVGGETHDVPEDAFSGPGAFRQTGVQCKLVVVSKEGKDV